MLLPALLAATALVLTPPCKSADITAGRDSLVAVSNLNKRSFKSIGPSGCLFEGRWFGSGAEVETGEACLRCACARGVLWCRRRACAPLPDPTPRRCHVLHRKGACCPELHCPDGILLMERGASSRFESDDDVGTASVGHVYPACVEGGSVFAAGSAMRAGVACEQCFCLGGSRRCVRPACLPAPAGCAPRPAPGACCPQRYYCRHDATRSPLPHHKHDCKIDKKWIAEGERVLSPVGDNCTQCFCLRGAVRCHPPACAPPLLGCEPQRQPGDCCPHHYRCQHETHGAHALTALSNSLVATRNDDRAFHTGKSNQREKTTDILTDLFTEKNIPLSATKNHLIGTTKVKRKTSEPPSLISSQMPPNVTTTAVPLATVAVTPLEQTTMDKLISTTETKPVSEPTTEPTSAEQPEGSVRIVINGTVNCTAELSSTSLPLNVTLNDTRKIQSETNPRVPLIDVTNLEDHTFSPDDIITDRFVNGGFDENESFVINVTSSLRANSSHAPAERPPPAPALAPSPAEAPLNSSKKTKGDYDYDYVEPTLPPSLPNLKIIPFVAADAVVEDDHAKEIHAYPMLEREDKFPVYYPTADTEASVYASRREDVYRPTQYPVFITDKPGRDRYPSMSAGAGLSDSGYSNIHTNSESAVNEFSLSASLGNRLSEDEAAATAPPLPTTAGFKLETPVVNLFSPPVETEGGFIPKGPTGLIDEYFAVFPSSPSGTAIPHLTTSMQLDVKKGECRTSDGRLVPEGESVSVSCEVCACAWGELQCAPRSCAAQSQCDPCCGNLGCDHGNNTTPVSVKLDKTIDAVKTSTAVTNSTPLASSTTLQPDVVKEPQIVPSPVSSLNFAENVTTTAIPFNITSEPPITTTVATVQDHSAQNNSQSLEYEEDDDEGFSFGSVLKLLLSDSYETTTAAPRRPPTTGKPRPPKTEPTTRRPRPTKAPVPPSRPTPEPFVPSPLGPRPYTPPKKNRNPIDRIDHLVLGEATAIETTARPSASTRRAATARPTAPSGPPSGPTDPTERSREESYAIREAPRPTAGIGPALLKLAGCNIYGRMYRVGRIIAELSTPCQECRCTELGVQCEQLKC